MGCLHDEQHQRACVECKNAHSTPFSFFKIMIGDFKDAMFIPRKFGQALGNFVDRDVSLEDSDGHSWRVEASVADGSLVFQRGWCDFVADHSINIGELLVFRRINKSLFSVQVFGTSACERVHFNGKSNCNVCQRDTVQTENDIELTPENLHFQKRCRLSEVSKEKCYPVNDNSVNDERVTKTGCDSFCNEMIGTKKDDDFKARENSAPHHDNPQRPQASNTKCFEDDMQTLCDNSVNEKRVTKTGCDSFRTEMIATKKDDDFNARVNSAPHHDNPQRPQASNTKCFEDAMQTLCELPGSCKFLVNDQGVCYIVDETLMDELGASGVTPINMDFSEQKGIFCQDDKATMTGDTFKSDSIQDYPRAKAKLGSSEISLRNDGSASHGMNDMYVPQKVPDMVEGTIADAFPNKDEGNDTFSSKGKAFGGVEPIIMDTSDSHSPNSVTFIFSLSVNAHSWLELPQRLPSRPIKKGSHRKERRVVVLRDPSMRQWPVLYHESIKFVGFVDGWEDFVKGNSLQQGDQCGFEVINKSESTIQVRFSKSSDS